jgi:ComF family protein
MAVHHKHKPPLKNQALGRLMRRAVDFLLPPRCLATGDIVAEHGTLSPAFWSELTFIEAPCCETCGIPFPFAATMGALCASCLELAPVFDRARSAVVYNEASRKLVIDFKYGDRLHAADTFLPWLRRAGAALLAETDYLVPVPLHRRRLWHRRFNQSALLAQGLAKSAGIPCLPDGLLRLRHTAQQKGLNRKERHRNVQNAFAVNGRHLPRLAGKNILLIDDVFTSGATLNECARILKKNKAQKVQVLTLARVTKEEFVY